MKKIIKSRKKLYKSMYFLIMAVLVINMSSLGVFFVAEETSATVGGLSITCDNIVIEGGVWTFSGGWEAIDFPGQDNQYNVAIFSPAGNSIDDDSKDTPDTFIITFGPSKYTGGNQEDM